MYRWSLGLGVITSFILAAPTSQVNADQSNRLQQYQERWDDAFEAGRRQVREGMERAREENRAERESEEKKFLRILDDKRGYRQDVQNLMREALSWTDTPWGVIPVERNIYAVGHVYKYLIDNAEFSRAGAAARLMEDIYLNAKQRYRDIDSMAEEPVESLSFSAIYSYIGINKVENISIDKIGQTKIRITFDDNGESHELLIHHPALIVSEAMGFPIQTVESDLSNAADFE